MYQTCLKYINYSSYARTAKFNVYSINLQSDERGIFADRLLEFKVDKTNFKVIMLQETFNELLSTIKDDTNVRNAVKGDLKLMLTLRYVNFSILVGSFLRFCKL